MAVIFLCIRWYLIYSNGPSYLVHIDNSSECMFFFLILHNLYIFCYVFLGLHLFTIFFYINRVAYAHKASVTIAQYNSDGLGILNLGFGNAMEKLF